jgi:hypothetical protein
MIEMKCPACGAEGRVSNDKVNTRLVCRKCLKVFHVTASGRAVLGEPLSAGTTSSSPHEPAALDRTQEVDQWFERMSRRLVSPATLATLAAVILLSGVLAFFSFRKSDTLQEQVTKVAVAAIEGDLQTIRSLAATGTVEDAVKWYDAIRPQCDQLRQRLSSYKPVVDVSIKQHESDPGLSEVIARVDSEEKLERRGNALPDPALSMTTLESRPVILPMTWRSEGWSGWRLDGKRTLEFGNTIGSTGP